MRSVPLFILIFLVACNSSEEPKAEVTSVAKPSPYSSLLSLYKPINGDTLSVFSSEHLESKEFAFYGEVIDSVNAMLFPKDIAEAHFADYPSLFACYKFPFGNGKVGLITRIPSVYMPSSIRLFILDTVKNTLEPSIELAEQVGDAGDILIKKSWVFKTSDRELNVLIWTKELHDHSVDEEVDSIPEKWDTYFLVSLSKNRQDTISQDSTALTKTFGQLLKSKPAANIGLPK